MGTEQTTFATPAVFADEGSELGRYVIRALVGEGAAARVYRAYDPLAERDVALKVLRTGTFGGAGGRSRLVRFQREAEAAGRLSHPNIVTIYDVTPDYIVMEYLDGITLESFLATRAPLSLPEASSILQPLAAALDYAHARGIVHRDIKPGNIIILGDGRPKITDFGVAHLESTSITAPGEFLGSPSYMSPEQVDGQSVSRRSDVFSLAAVAYEMLTGQRAFGGASIPAALHAVLHATPDPPTRLRPELPAHFDAVFARALAKKPEDRYESPGELAAALDAAGYARALARIARGEAGPTPAPRPPGVPAGSLAAVETQELPPRPSRPWSVAGGATMPVARGRRLTRWVAVVAVGAAILGGVTFARLDRRPSAGGLGAPARPSLTLRTRPSGASVWLDDAPVGSSPITGLDLPLGRHTLVVDRAGYAPLRLKFETRTDAPAAELTVALHRRDAMSARPAGATLAVTRPGGSINTVDADGAQSSSSQRISTRPDGWIPPRRLSGDPPQFPAAALLSRQQGTVVVELTVDQDGRPIDAAIVESAGDLFDQAVLDAIQTWRFDPAVRGGQPVPVRWQVRQRFELQ